MLLPLLYACTPDEPRPLPGAVPVPGSCWVTQDVSSGALVSAWRAPDGTLYAVGASLSARMRAPDGSWALDPMDPDLEDAERVHGAGDTVWALTRFLALERQPDGTWLDRQVPVEVNEPQGLHVFGPDDVLVLKVEDIGCDDCYTQDTPVLLWWDGTSWTEQREPMVDGPVYGMAVLPDRTVLLATGDLGLSIAGGGTVSTPPEFHVRAVFSAPDDTLVALAADEIAMGDLAGGLVSADPGVEVDEWTHAWASSASDVWVSGTRWEQGDVSRAVIVHWDGSAWTLMVEDQDGPLWLTGGDGEVFAVGTYDRELVWVGDEDGLAVEREIWGPGGIRDIVVDDVTGQAWSYGYTPALGVFEDGLWSGLPLPDPTMRPGGMAVSDGRVVMRDDEGLYVLEGGVQTATTPESITWRDLAGADGVLFAAGVNYVYGSSALPGVAVMREAGEGWELIDTSALPEGSEPAGMWADGPDDLWLGLHLDELGGLAHWDGSTWTLALEGLKDGPSELRRLSDGQLYFTQFIEAGEGTDGLWVYDGQSAYSLPDMPLDVREAHLLPDGTWFVSAFARTGDDSLYAHLLQREPGGDWVEVFTNDYGIALAGTDDTVWSEQVELSWTYAPCP
jgi:hypothetical protein